MDFGADEQVGTGEVFFNLFIGGFVGGHDEDFVVFGQQILPEIPQKIGLASFNLDSDFLVIPTGNYIDAAG